MTDLMDMGDTESHTSPDTAGVESPAGAAASQIRDRRPIPFGKYELLSRLRVGGMAELFRARELSEPARVVAVKRILPSFTDEADYVAMFIDEARLGMRLDHPSIVKALEIGQVEDELYIALEYVHGQDMSALLRRAREAKEPLPVAVACRIALDVCSALQYAHELRDEQGHELGIVHRDVSPQNVLVSYDGDVKLIDFGIAKSSEQLMRTQAGLLKGKHGYLSPEQAQGRTVDARSDQFSLGTCLYEMLTAERLFEGSSDFSTIVKVRNAEVPALRQRNAQVPEQLAAIVHRALAPTPGERFESAAAMGSALARFVEECGELCDRARLAEYMRTSFAQALAEATPEPSEDAPRDAGTGLLDAFDDVEPPSAVSSLAQPEQRPSADAPAEPSAFDTIELEPSAATPLAEASSDLLEEVGSDADAGDGDAEYEDVGHLASDVSSRAAAGSQGDLVIAGRPLSEQPPESQDALRGDATTRVETTARAEATTRVVEYESTEHGEIVADEPTGVMSAPEPPVESAARAEAPAVDPDPEVDTERPPDADDTRPRRRPRAPPMKTLPGADMGWDDEDLSTHLYDSRSPSDEPIASLPSIVAEQSLRAMSTPAVASLSPSRPAGLGSQPQLPPARASLGAPAQFSALRPPAPAGVVPEGYAATPSPRTPALSSLAGLSLLPRSYGRGTLALIAGAAIAVIVAAVALGSWLVREPARSVLHLTTDPLDAMVMLDGVAAGGSSSPFLLTDIESGAGHEVEVRRTGYKSWHTHLVLRSGQVVKLPHVTLMRDPEAYSPPIQPRPPPVAAAPPAPVPAPGVAKPAPQPTSEARPVFAPPHYTPAAPRKPRDRIDERGSAPEAAGGGTGTLRINSRPWSRVYVDGRLVGTTPQPNLLLGASRHTVTLVNPDFNLKKVLTIELKRGQTVTKIVDLAQ